MRQLTHFFQLHSAMMLMFVVSLFPIIVSTSVLPTFNSHFISSVFQPVGISTNKSDVNSSSVNTTISLHSITENQTSSYFKHDVDNIDNCQSEDKRLSIFLENMHLSKNDTMTLINKLELPNNNYTSIKLHICTGISTIDMSTIIKSCLKNTSNLSSLSLTHCGLNKESFYKIRNNKMLLSNSIKSLDLSFNPLHAHIEKKKDLVSSFFSLDSFNSLTASVAETLSSSSNCGGNSYSNTKLLTAPSSSSSSSSSSSLLLPSSSYPLLASIIKRLNSLQSLNLNGNSFKNLEDFNTIIYSIRRHPSITDISLSACDVKDEHMESLGFGLKSNYNISRINLNMNKITSKGIFILASIFKSSSSSSLSVKPFINHNKKSRNSQTTATATTNLKTMTTIPTAIGKNLKYLDLSYNPIGSDGLMMIADLIQSNKLPSLEYLILRQVSANPESINALLTALNNRDHNNNKLVYLDLSGNTLFSSSSSSSDSVVSETGILNNKKKGHHKSSKSKISGSGSSSGGKSLKQVKQVLHNQWNEWTTQAHAYSTSSSSVINNFQASLSKSMNGLLQQVSGSDTNSNDDDDDDDDEGIKKKKKKMMMMMKKKSKNQSQSKSSAKLSASSRNKKAINGSSSKRFKNKLIKRNDDDDENDDDDVSVPLSKSLSSSSSLQNKSRGKALKALVAKKVSSANDILREQSLNDDDDDDDDNKIKNRIVDNLRGGIDQQQQQQEQSSKKMTIKKSSNKKSIKQVNKKRMKKSRPSPLELSSSSSSSSLSSSSLEEIQKRYARQLDDKILHQLFQLLLRSPCLRYVGLAKVGLSDSIIVRASSVTAKYTNVNTNTSNTLAMITTANKASSSSRIRVQLVAGRVLPSLTEIPYSAHWTPLVDTIVPATTDCTTSSSSSNNDKSGNNSSTVSYSMMSQGVTVDNSYSGNISNNSHNSHNSKLQSKSRVIDVMLALNSGISHHHMDQLIDVLNSVVMSSSSSS